MIFLLHLFILSFCGKLVSSFNCIDVTNQTKCDKLGYGCAWVNSVCDGNYEPPTCTGCVYVDSYNPAAGNGAGTLANPFKTLNAALLPDTAARVLTTIILNYRDVTIVNQTVTIALTGTHTIK